MTLVMASNDPIGQSSADERRLRRLAWPVRRFRLGSEPDEDLSATTTAEERIAMMWPLALDAFSVGPGDSESSARTTWPVIVRALDDPGVE